MLYHDVLNILCECYSNDVNLFQFLTNCIIVSSLLYYMLFCLVEIVKCVMCSLQLFVVDEVAYAGQPVGIIVAGEKYIQVWI